jgi:hypothetical protein
MAGLADTNTVDVVAQDAAGQVLVVMVETRRWGMDRAQSSQLRAEINAYAGFITDGSLLRRYPEAAGQKIEGVPYGGGGLRNLDRWLFPTKTSISSPSTKAALWRFHAPSSQ